jgi:hypothetical protein
LFIIIIDTFGAEIPNEPKIPARMGIIDNNYSFINNLTDDSTLKVDIGIEILGESFHPIIQNYSMK